MIKYIRKTTGTLTVGRETLVDIFGGVLGKSIRVKGLYTSPVANLYIRCYRNAEQIVDADSQICTSGSPIMPLDIPIAAGEIFSAGFYNNGAATTAKEITVMYEET